MNRHNLYKKLHLAGRRCCLTLFALAVTACTVWFSTDFANALYILTDEQGVSLALDEDAQVRDFSSQLIYVSSSSKGYDLTLTSGQTVTIHYNGATVSVQSRRETVSALLGRMHIDLAPLEMVAVDLSGSGVTLTVSEEITYYDKVTETDPHRTQKIENPNLPQGTEQVVQIGQDGVRGAIYEMVWSGGELVSRQFVEEISTSSIDRIIEVGTGVEGSAALPTESVVNVTKNADGSGYLTLASGATMPFTGTKSMTATAYTAGHGGADYTTATGTLVEVGTVAVDKSVIPLGTRMYIVTNDGVVYGMAVAEDTGVRGNVIDLYYDTYEQCINFGRRACTVYILE